MLVARESRDDSFGEINVTPFTDVLLVLLVIFMILASLVTPTGFEKRVPCHCKGAATHKLLPRVVAVTIAPSGETSVNGIRVNDRSIYDTIQRAAFGFAHVRVEIRAESTAPYGGVIRAIDAAKAAQLDDVTFVAL